ncbi:hypothetical protein [Anabaena sp. CCY 9910]
MHSLISCTLAITSSSIDNPEVEQGVEREVEREVEQASLACVD